MVLLVHQVLVTNLVDSNVFVRSVVLSMDYFKRCQQVDYGCLVLASGVCSTERRANMSSAGYMVDRMSPIDTRQDEDFCKITAFVSHNTLRLLRELMGAVRLSEINQVIKFRKLWRNCGTSSSSCRY